jgi:hypothetical protein
MDVENQIVLNRFIPRDYQNPLISAIEHDGYKRAMIVWPRRAGKDVVALNLLLRAALRKPIVAFYLFPTYAQAKKVIWKSLTSDGKPFMDFIPSELISKTSVQDMSITLRNGSIIQLLGSDNYDSLVGTNPSMIILSEYALQDANAFRYLSPALKYNDGTAIFITTPRGHNHAFDLWNIAQQNPNVWFSQALTIEDTGHISVQDVEDEIARGEISRDLAQQEYYVSWDKGVEGSYYSKYIDKMRLNDQIGNIPYESSFKVHVAFDIGNDCTSCIFFQTIGNTVNIIDYYENSGSGHGLEHYAKVILSKEYIYGKHVFPHDMAVTEWGGIRQTRLEKAKTLGLDGIICERKDIDDGIEAVRSLLGRVYIDETKCKQLIKSLNNYRQDYDPKRNVYSGIPLHDWSSHAADAMRYLALSVKKLQPNTSPEELERRYREATGGARYNMPSMFRDDLPPY